MPGLIDPSGAPLPGAPLAGLLAAQADRAPRAAALSVGGGVVSRLDLDRRSTQRARWLADQGVRHEDRVIVALPNGTDYYESVFGLWKLGATPIQVSHKLTPQEFGEIVALAAPTCVLGGPESGGKTVGLPDAGDYSFDPLPLNIAPRWKISTSGGSTGRPKLIVDTTPALWGPEKQGQRRRPDAVMINPAPLYHSAPFGLMIPALCEGAHVIEMGGFDAERYLDLVTTHRATWAYLVPTMMSRIAKLSEAVRDRYDVSSLETVFHMAAMCPVWVKRFWIDWLGPDAIWEVYGGTERIGATVIGGADWLAHPGSVGQPRAGVDIRILDEAGGPVPRGEVGEIYFRRPGGPASTFHYIGADVRQQGDWASFGDLGRLDADGYLFLADRRTDMIICGGVNLYPAEIEAAIDALPGVDTSVVVGAPDDDLGQIPTAFVRLRDDTDAAWTERSLIAALDDRLAPNKRPRRVILTDEPIRDEAGKVRRSAWRDRLLER